MLETAFTQLNNYFSPRFVLSQFLSVFTVVSVNLLLGALYNLGWAASLSYVMDTLKIGDVATAVAVVASLSAVIAFTLTPLVNALQRILEGVLLPQFVRDRLIDANRSWAHRQFGEIEAISAYAIPLDQAWRSVRRPLGRKV